MPSAVGGGSERYPNPSSLLITFDGGGSNSSRVRLWKLELQKLADEFGMPITVCHLPPGTSKWNRIEHKLLSFITGNWRSKLLVSRQVIVQLIAATATKAGLKACYELDQSIYLASVKVSDAEIGAVNLTRHDFHGEWNYTVRPSLPLSKR
jgi:Rhodopirellula transposase DDE domain